MMNNIKVGDKVKLYDGTLATVTSIDIDNDEVTVSYTLEEIVPIDCIEVIHRKTI